MMKASGAGRCCHHPTTRPAGGTLPTPSEPKGLLHEEAGGTFPADGAPGRDLAIATSTTVAVGLPFGRPRPAETRPFSTDPRPQPSPPCGRAGICGIARGARLITGACPRSLGRKASLVRTTWPSASMTSGLPRLLAPSPRPPTPDGPPWEGPQPSADPHRSAGALQGRTQLAVQPDASAYWQKA